MSAFFISKNSEMLRPKHISAILSVYFTDFDEQTDNLSGLFKWHGNCFIVPHT